MNFLQKTNYKKQKGFSLIELSVIISVAAAVTVGLLSWTQPTTITDSRKAVETQQMMREINEAIKTFRVKQGRLPCPADPYMRADNTRNTAGGTDYYVNDFGREDLDFDQNEVNSLTTKGIDCPNNVGAVPVYDLSLDQKYMFDGWGRKFTYAVSSNICGADLGMDVLSSEQVSRDVGCNKQSYEKGFGDLTVHNGTQNITQKAAIVLLSHGANGSGAFLPSGQKMSDSGDTSEDINSDYSSSTFRKAPPSATFDDIVDFATKDQIEKLIDNSNRNQISVADCEANSQAIKNFNLTKAAELDTYLTSYSNDSSPTTGQNTGEEVALSIMFNVQAICIKYYGIPADDTTETIKGQSWNGPQCPGYTGDANGPADTYNAQKNVCTCADGDWDGSCTPDWDSTFTVRNNMVLWLDATDSSTLFTNIDCRNGQAPANGVDVNCWADKSPSGVHAIAGTDSSAIYNANAPSYNSSAINTRPAIYFRKGNVEQMVLADANVLLAENADRTYFFVFNRENVEYGTPNANEQLVGYNTQNLWGVGNTNLFFVQNGIASDTSYGILTFGNNHIVSLDSGASSTNAYLNGISTEFDNQYNPPAASWPIDHRFAIGGSNATTFPGFIGEIIIYNVILNNRKRKEVEIYLSDKWGITITH